MKLKIKLCLLCKRGETVGKSCYCAECIKNHRYSRAYFDEHGNLAFTFLGAVRKRKKQPARK